MVMNEFPYAIYQQQLTAHVNLDPTGLSDMALQHVEFEVLGLRQECLEIVSKKASNYWCWLMLTWCETVSLFTCFLGLGVCTLGTGGESGTTGRGKKKQINKI